MPASNGAAADASDAPATAAEPPTQPEEEIISIAADADDSAAQPSQLQTQQQQSPRELRAAEAATPGVIGNGVASSPGLSVVSSCYHPATTLGSCGVTFEQRCAVLCFAWTFRVMRALLEWQLRAGDCVTGCSSNTPCSSPSMYTRVHYALPRALHRRRGAAQTAVLRAHPGGQRRHARRAVDGAGGRPAAARGAARRGRAVGERERRRGRRAARPELLRDPGARQRLRRWVLSIIHILTLAQTRTLNADPSAKLDPNPGPGLERG